MKVTKQSWIDIASFQIGGAISLPLILVGFELQRKMGFAHALAIIGIGNMFLFALSLVGARLSQESENTTAETAARYLQAGGKVLFACVILFSSAAWFAIQTNLVGHDLAHLVHTWFLYMPREPVVNAILALVMCISAYFGLRGMIYFAHCSVPFLCACFVYALATTAYTSEKSVASEPLSSGFSLDGMALVIGCVIAAVIDMPTLYRHARGVRDAMKVAAAVFFVAVPLIECVGLFLGFWSEASGLIEALISQSGALLSIGIACFVALAGWTTNNSNFYSATAALATLFPKMGERNNAFIIMALCISLSALPLGTSFLVCLELMSILGVSLGGSVLGGYLLEKYSGRRLRPEHYYGALFAGLGLGLVSFFRGGFFLSQPTLESLLGVVSMLCLFQFFSREVPHEIPTT